ncbi:hypothetical protein R6Q57_018054 [Mikania cordata]
MLQLQSTIEEQLILRAIKEECGWESLPKRLQASLNSKDEWHRRIIAHCIKRRLLWRTSFVRKVCREGEYYEDMMRYLRKNLALFPYHLAEYVCRSMRITPFRYYCDMLFEVMKNDALRLTGIGRNEFIDIMNKCRSKKIMWKLNKSIARELLPTQPVDITIEPWWGVCLVNFTLEEFKKLSEEESATIDKICKEEVNAFMLFDPVVIKGLHRRGLVYLDVCVYAEDRFKVCRLEGFVSNREQSYEDPIEELLYAVFVVSSENSTVAELATTLQVQLSQLQAAASFACRLGWAVKLIDPGSILQEPNSPTKNAISDDDEASRTSVGSLNMSVDAAVFDQDSTDNSGYTRVAFVVDANITSYLMMGSVSPGLKSHAVTLYEAGKLGHASIRDLCNDLSSLEGAKFEGVLQEFANHAFSLRSILECLTSGGITSNNEEIVSMTAGHAVVHESDDSEDPNDADKVSNKKIRKYNVDILRCESLATLAATTLDRLFRRNYEIVVSMLPHPHSSVLPGPKVPVHFGPPSYSSLTPWMKLVLYSAARSGPLSVVLMKGQCLRLLPAPLSGCEKALLWSWDESSVNKFDQRLVKGNILLHCLNSLLKHTAILVQPLSKYDLDNHGNFSTMDVPLPLKNSDGSVPDIGKELGLDMKESSKLKFLLENLGTRIELWTVGYIRLLKLFKESDPNSFAPDEYEWVPLSIEFGIPLSSPDLCYSICERIVSSQLLQANLFTDHQNSMQELRTMLQKVCSEYQATGSTARMFYQRDQPKAEQTKSQNKLLMTYASQRWNPLTDPSSPISGMSDHQRLKLANRQRCGSEVLSFDGNILRSYALSPIYETVMGMFEEASDSNGVKSDDMDSREAILPGVNLLFDGSELRPFDIGACLQARQPVSLIVEASLASASSSGIK